jgi:hypothetical protein
MIEKHPSEAELQEFALDKSRTEIKIVEHIEFCRQCQKQVAGYQLVFSAMAAQEKPSFDFDLTDLVMLQVSQQKSRYSLDNWFLYLTAAVIIGITGFVGYRFGDAILDLFRGLGSLLMPLIVITALVILIFQGIDIYKKYQRKIDVLDFY